MRNYKNEIAKKISECTEIKVEEIEQYIEVPENSKMGDMAFPCFKLAKELKKSPQIIANDIKNKINFTDNLVDKIEVSGGYLNFFINKTILVQEIVQEFIDKKENYGRVNIGQNKNIVIDYSSPNIAKPFHIGHLRSTVIGGALYKIYEFLGYNSIGINFIGDWGVQFGKVMAGLSLWKDEYDFNSENEIDVILKVYVRFSNEEKDNPELTNLAKQYLKKLEDGDEEAYKTWKWLRKISLENYQKTYDLLNVKFDYYRGEAYYNDKMDDVIQELKQKNLLKESQGALIVDLDEYNMPPCILITSMGTTIYSTRDLASLKDRINCFNFEKALYVVGSEQELHFKQIFKVLELMGYEEYAKKCEYVPFGLVVGKDGQKIGTRKGNSVSLDNILRESIDKVKKIMESKNLELVENKEISRKIGVGAIIFNDLSNSRIKNEIFDWDSILNFNGQTGPYVQYMYVRTKSVLEKANFMECPSKIKIEALLDNEAIEIIKLLGNFTENVINAANKNEPYIIARYLLDLSKSYSNFYSEHKIIVEDEEIKQARLFLTYFVNVVLKTAASLLGMEMPEKM